MLECKNETEEELCTLSSRCVRWTAPERGHAASDVHCTKEPGKEMGTPELPTVREGGREGGGREGGKEGRGQKANEKRERERESKELFKYYLTVESPCLHSV